MIYRFDPSSLGCLIQDPVSPDIYSGPLYIGFTTRRSRKDLNVCEFIAVMQSRKSIECFMITGKEPKVTFLTLSQVADTYYDFLFEFPLMSPRVRLAKATIRRGVFTDVSRLFLMGDREDEVCSIL